MESFRFLFCVASQTEISEHTVRYERISVFTLGICRHDMLIPIELECGHKFCCGCIEEYSKVWVISCISDQTKSKCPLCCDNIMKKRIDNVACSIFVYRSSRTMF